MDKKQKIFLRCVLVVAGMWYNKPRLSSLGCKNCGAILVGMIYAVAFIDMV